MELLPFAGEVVVLSLKGADIWAAMNHSLSLWPGPAGLAQSIILIKEHN